MKIFSSLTNRIFVASAALTILCISTAIYIVNQGVTAAAEDELQRELVQAGSLVDEQRATVSDWFAVFARTVADLPKLKAAVSTDDPPTVQPIAAEYARSVRADLLLVTNRSGRVLAELLQSGAAPSTVSLPPLDLALAGRASSTFSKFPGGVLQVVSVPITAGEAPPEIVGTLSLGFVLDDAIAARFKALTGSEIAFATSSRVVASTLPRGGRSDVDSLPVHPGISRVRAHGDDYLALVRPMVAATRSTFGNEPAPVVAQGTAHPVAIILRSRTERLRLLRPIRTMLVGTGALAIVLAVALSYTISRTITRPLAAITDTMKEMAATGDLTRRIAWPAGRWTDEDAQLLARTFNRLTGSITRFQHEAAQRERLSALGRLSTVIAHEVRNPLMIIKASLRPLMSGGAPAADIREAAVDIDEEVTRLNRLVNDVLDFARPLRFDRAPTDINAVCTQSAAAAASGGESAASIHLALEPSLPTVVTDAERLRSALVNVLVNARHAVAAREASSAPPNGHDIELATERLPGSRIAIEVRDRGVGIDPDDLPRVFEPYFTTRRAGTGLGLAITRNIVEGLGGIIEVHSQVGSGTRVRIELPEQDHEHTRLDPPR